VVGGATNNGGIVLDWLRSAIAPDVGEDPAAVLALAERAVAGAGGLLFLPYLVGERAPHWRPGARGVYLGLTREHRREHLVRAAIEGVCFQLALVLGALGEAGIEVESVRATGGFSRSALWRRILASAFGRPIGFAASPEGSALGAALLGMTALGMLDSLDRGAEIVTVTETQEPDVAEAAIYAQLLPVFDASFDALTGAFDALAGVERLAPVGRAEDR
jgi:gluconokinase